MKTGDDAAMDNMNPHHVSEVVTKDTISTAYACYVPHDLGYNPEFEDALIRAVLEQKVANASQTVKSDVDDAEVLELPIIKEDELPLPLDDTRRVYPSPVAGLRLTHPGGYLEGGPGLDPDMDTFQIGRAHV